MDIEPEMDAQIRGTLLYKGGGVPGDFDFDDESKRLNCLLHYL